LKRTDAEMDRLFAGRQVAYVAVHEGLAEGRAVVGVYLGLVVAGEPAYHQLKPGYGPYPDHEAGKRHARELNHAMGVDDRRAFDIAISSMAAQNRANRGRRRPPDTGAPAHLGGERETPTEVPREY